MSPSVRACTRQRLPNHGTGRVTRPLHRWLSRAQRIGLRERENRGVAASSQQVHCEDQASSREDVEDQGGCGRSVSVDVPCRRHRLLHPHRSISSRQIDGLCLSGWPSLTRQQHERRRLEPPYTRHDKARPASGGKDQLDSRWPMSQANAKSKPCPARNQANGQTRDPHTPLQLASCMVVHSFRTPRLYPVFGAD